MADEQSPPESTGKTTTVRYEAVPSIAIPDNHPSGVISTIDVPVEGWATKIIVQVEIKHTYVGDIVVALIPPDGSEIVLRNREGESANDISQVFDSSEFPALIPLLGLPVQGNWNLRVTDLAERDVGSLESWSIAIDIATAPPDEVHPPPEPRAVDVPIHPDDPASTDELARRPFAEVIASCIRLVWQEKQEEPPKKRSGGLRRQDESSGDAFMVHIHGPWGAGKTSVLNFLRESLCSSYTVDKDRDPDTTKWIAIDFNAWRHQRIRPPWWPLIKAVYRQSVKQLWKDVPLRASMIFLREKLWHFRTGIAPYILALAFLLWLLSIATGFIGAGSGTAAVSESPQRIKVNLELIAAIFGLWGLLLGIFRTFLHGSAGTARMILELSRDPLRPLVHHFRGLITSIVRPVAVFIDDLDRCEADFVVELLRGIQTLFHESNVTYIIAADREWLRACYESAYPDFMSINEPGRPLGYLFLDKLFQISAPLPRLIPDSQQKYLKYLVGVGESDKHDEEQNNKLMKEAEADLSGSYDHKKVLEKIRAAKDNPNRQLAYRAIAARRSVSAEARERHSHVLQDYAHLLESNPRAMKRLVNAFAIQNAISILSERDIPLDPLVRWTIIEMRWPLLSRFLESNLKSISSKKTLPDKMDDTIRLLLQNDSVIDVIEGKNVPNAKPLDAETLFQIFGREASAE